MKKYVRNTNLNSTSNLFYRYFKNFIQNAQQNVYLDYNLTLEGEPFYSIGTQIYIVSDLIFVGRRLKNVSNSDPYTNQYIKEFLDPDLYFDESLTYEMHENENTDTYGSEENQYKYNFPHNGTNSTYPGYFLRINMTEIEASKNWFGAPWMYEMENVL